MRLGIGSVRRGPGGGAAVSSVGSSTYVRQGRLCLRLKIRVSVVRFRPWPPFLCCVPTAFPPIGIYVSGAQKAVVLQVYCWTMPCIVRLASAVQTKAVPRVSTKSRPIVMASLQPVMGV